MRTNDKLPPVEEHPTRSGRRLPQMTRTRRWLFGSTLAVYAAIVIGVVTSSWLVRLDWQLMLFRPYKQWPEVHAFLDYFVVLGQRGPTALAVLAWLGWCAWRQYTLRPLLVLGTSLLLLNVTVGAAKIGLGRFGPHYATEMGATEMWQGGDIFPSGHTANAVVTWGVLAYMAATPRARRIASVISASVALSVGGTTVYLGTHWISDVLLGWAAGLLVLLALPWCEPWMARAEVYLMALRDRVLADFRAGLPALPGPAGAPVAIISQRHTAANGAADPAAAAAVNGQPMMPEMAGASAPPAPAAPSSTPPSASTPQATATAESRPHLPPRAHTARHERTPVTPVGSRRPPHTDRPGRPQARSAGG